MYTVFGFTHTFKTLFLSIRFQNLLVFVLVFALASAFVGRVVTTSTLFKIYENSQTVKQQITIRNVKSVIPAFIGCGISRFVFGYARTK